SHGSTFGGNPLACAAALAVLRTIDAENLLAHVTRESEFLLSELRARLADVPGVVEVRGFGLLLGIELDRPCGELVRQALEQKLLINVTADRVVRLLPPLIIQRTESEQLLDTLCPLIEQFCKGT